MSHADAECESGHRVYHRAAGAGPPRPTLLAAVEAFAREGRHGLHAVDLGCGIGRDALPLLAQGWRVTGIDRDAEALAELRRRAGATDRLETMSGRFEEVPIPACDLVNASFALPLCDPSRFPGLWARIRAALGPGGRFAGQLYGPRDEWAGRPGVATHTRGEVEALLAGLSVERLDEEESDAVTPRGQPKHWHVWHIVARAPQPRIGRRPIGMKTL
jgi:SAM-dependent methyltransferase